MGVKTGNQGRLTESAHGKDWRKRKEGQENIVFRCWIGKVLGFKKEEKGQSGLNISEKEHRI